MTTRTCALGLSLALLSALPILAATPAAPVDPFPGLKTEKLPGYETAVLHYDPQITEMIGKRLSTGDEPMVIRVCRTKLDRTKDAWYFVDYDEGPSADPYFMITPEGAKEPAVSISALHLYLPGNGSAYSSGHTDNMFDEHRKYAAHGVRIDETKQPYLYVGLEGKAKKDVTLYTGKDQKEVVAAIPKGTVMTVLLGDGEDNYLVKTAFGLVGWTHIAGDTQESQVIDGLFFAGD
jgi:hypothetical protein